MANKNPYAEHLSLARLQLKRLDNAAIKFSNMSSEWADLDNGILTEMDQLVERVLNVKKLLNELMEDCRRGREWN